MMTKATNPLPAVPPQVRARLERQLNDGEKLLWVEQPDARRWRRPGYLALPFGAAIIFFVLQKLPNTSGGWLLALGPLALLGLLLLGAPFLQHASARATVYALTSERALILSNRKHGALRAYRLRELGEWQTRRRADASGDLILETEEYHTDADGHTLTREHGFFAIADLRRVESMIEGLKRGEAPDAVLRRAALWSEV